jgi:GNAT superfamily N-acetyltransferase
MPDQNDPSPQKKEAQQNIEIKLVIAWPSKDIVELYKAGGWWKDTYDPVGIPGVISGSFAFAVAINQVTGTAIGMGRVISDGVSDAYIQDVVVLDDWRGKGLGKAIVKKLLDFCLDHKLHWIGLVAEPGTKGLYTPLGFKTLPGEPMVYRPEE